MEFKRRKSCSDRWEIFRGRNLDSVGTLLKIGSNGGSSSVLVSVKEIAAVQYDDDVVSQLLSVGYEEVKLSVAARNVYEFAFVSP